MVLVLLAWERSIAGKQQNHSYELFCFSKKRLTNILAKKAERTMKQNHTFGGSTSIWWISLSLGVRAVIVLETPCASLSASKEVMGSAPSGL